MEFTELVKAVVVGNVISWLMSLCLSGLLLVVALTVKAVNK